MKKLAACEDCHRSMRPYKSKAEDYPAYMPKAGARGRCTTCYMRLVRSENFTPTERKAAVKPCTRCGRLMRPIQALARDWPGTVSRINATSCTTCWRTHGPLEDGSTGDIPDHLAGYLRSRHKRKAQPTKPYLRKVSA